MKALKIIIYVSYHDDKSKEIALTNIVNEKPSCICSC